MKKILPVDVQAMNLVNATETLEAAVRSSWTAKKWVEDGVVPRNTDRFQTVPGRFSSKLFTDGSVVRSVFKDGELQRIPPVTVFAKNRSYLSQEFAEAETEFPLRSKWFPLHPAPSVFRDCGLGLRV